jgi:2-succinyl-5-enolpyruvyl-6-hydroxy-3-cyclohexene-1-carboxylate synthase
LTDSAEVELPSVRPVLRLETRQAEPLRLDAGTPTVILCGDASPEVGAKAARLAAESGWPLVAGPSSNARFGAALSSGRLLLDSALGHRIRRVVVFGHPTLSRPVTRLLSRADVEIVVVGRSGDLFDPGRRATVFADEVLAEPGDKVWLTEWRQADADMGERVADVLAAQPGVCGPVLARAVWDSAPEVLVVGNSNPIRDLDLAPVGPETPRVYANRGLSGIDGTVSTAIGVARATGRPTVLYLGDLAFIHDINALAAPTAETLPSLRVVVADDSGGSIFATLEYGREPFASAFERVFATPVAADIPKLAAGFGVPVTQVRDLDGLRAALARPITGPEVVWVQVDRSRRTSLYDKLSELTGAIA